ncbi:MAG: hypothetical protein COT91_05405 [Candidatus Doudnabacteria bacterium CG10_big_fil_rev_8_21_14_0_10_41_10]|uniref:Uncharacterized protein n=1 Tax=Candidatus Doudnabacteria bacterium CG10_big_fil_rev_8_21_14_0_10_41_10 TaxID=1974551 RepID=A0A2H0VEH2_9BACT|nr:MAG: hypothetical protein COT91_05405 [Candidatus Doudnabacteria bacterium CG10_big_fil_rev_8_21_14_0_10_41_10]
MKKLIFSFVIMYFTNVDFALKEETSGHNQQKNNDPCGKSREYSTRDNKRLIETFKLLHYLCKPFT